jgi:hypothetical protein
MSPALRAAANAAHGEILGMEREPMATDDLSSRRARRWPAWRRWPMRNGHPARDAAIGAVVLGYAWILGGLAPFTMTSLVGVLIPGALLVAIAYGKPPQRIPPPDRLDVTGASYWLIAVAALFEWEASAFRDDSRPWHPALTTLVNSVISPHPLKSAAVVVWLMVGWGLVRR